MGQTKGLESAILCLISKHYVFFLIPEYHKQNQNALLFHLLGEKINPVKQRISAGIIWGYRKLLHNNQTFLWSISHPHMVDEPYL